MTIMGLTVGYVPRRDSAYDFDFSEFNPLPAGAESAPANSDSPVYFGTLLAPQSGLLFDRNVIFDLAHASDRLGQFSGPALLVFGVHEAA